MPIVTQQRTQPSVYPTGRHTLGDGRTFEGFLALHQPLQTTTSYRSKRGENAGTESDAQSGEDLRRELRDRYKTRFDNGHEFSTQGGSYTVTHLNGWCSSRLPGTSASWYRGIMYPSVLGTVAAYPTPSYPNLEKIKADGRKAIAMSLPTAPEASLATFLGELREKLPQFAGLTAYRSGINRQAIGGEYLNYEFGIKPFINDLENFARAVQKGSKIAAQLRRDSGQNIRRKRTLLDEKFSTDRGTHTGHVAMCNIPGVQDTPGAYFSNGVTRVHDVEHHRVWFSGAFTYHLQEAENLLLTMERYEQLANKLLGTRITPEVVWELTPWSWLIDWVSDVGVFMKNISYLSQDSLVLRYGYIMHETRATRTRTVTNMKPKTSLGTCPPSVSSFHEVYRKTRTRSTPYGFSLDVEKFSPRQWAILGALGISKGPNRLGI